MKIVTLGAGSGFGGRLSVDMMSREALREATIGLVDIHAGRLGKVLGYSISRCHTYWCTAPSEPPRGHQQWNK